MHTLPSTTTKSVKRLGRGYGSGKGGHTVGRGTKGKRARVGRTIPLWFEGGQLPFVKRLPYLRGKLRFSSLHGETQLVTLSHLEKLKEKDITLEVLKKHRLITSIKQPVKITAVGVITRAVVCTGIPATTSARAAVEKAGGSLA